MAADASFGPVPDGAEVEEVFEDPEAGFDVMQLPVGGDDLGGGGLGRGEARW